MVPPRTTLPADSATATLTLRVFFAAALLTAGVYSCASSGWVPVTVDPEVENEQYASMVGARVRLHLNDGRRIELMVTEYEAPMLRGKSRRFNDIVAIDVRDVREVILRETRHSRYTALRVMGPVGAVALGVLLVFLLL